MDILKLNFFFIPGYKSSKRKSRKHNGRTNLLQLLRVEDIDIDQVLDSFVKKNPRRLLARSTLPD